MPRRIAEDDDETPRPRRRRGAKAVAIEADAESERGLMMRALLHSPKDTVAGLLAVTAIGAIVANALFLQSGPHPSPMFGSVVTLPAPGTPQTNPLPRPRPSDATKTDAAPPEPRQIELRLVEPRAAEPKSAEPRSIDGKPVEPKVVDPKASDNKASDNKAADPLTNLVKVTGSAPMATASIPRPPAPVPVSSRDDAISPNGSRRVAAVQRALTEYGYGQLKPTGTIGPDTQAAIVKFERARKIPANGQLTARMVHELAAMIGHPID